MHRENNDGDNTFTLAIESKPLELLRTLTEQGRNIHLPDDSKDDASILATKGDQLDLVRWLAEQGCYIHQINYDGDNAVSLAARSGNLDLVRWLVEQGCYIHQINNAGDNAITVAVWSGKLDLVQWLASQGCNIHKVNHYGNNALSHAVRLGDLHLDLIQWLVDQECNIYQVNRNGETPLIIATENNCLETVKCLLEKSRSLCQIDPSVFAALKIAINNNKPLIAECLIKSGADFTLFRTKDGDGLLAWALKNRHLDIIQYLLPLHHPALRSASGDTVLMTAAKLGLVEFALPLIRTALQHREGPSLLGEAQFVATHPLFKECLAQPGLLLLPELAPSMSTMRAQGFADIATRVVLDHYFSLCNALSSLSPLLGAPQDMSALQNMAAEAGILAGLAAWKQLNYSDNIFLPDAINNPPGLADRFNQFISKDIDQLVAQALQWEEDNLVPVVGDLYEICLRHVIAGNRASDIASELARKGLYQPIASRIASAWHTTWESASNEAAPLLQPMITSSFDDWEHEDLAAMDPITGLPVVTPEAVASMIEHFVETAAGAGLLQRFRSALQRELDSTGQGLLRAQAPNLSQSSKDLYADLIMRQLHMVAQFWRQG